MKPENHQKMRLVTIIRVHPRFEIVLTLTG